jgi:hypothetical protein
MRFVRTSNPLSLPCTCQSRDMKPE